MGMELEMKGVSRETFNTNLDESAKTVRSLYESYLKVGFTSEQAFELVKILVKEILEPTR